MNADETTLKQAARRLVKESRAPQGLPAKVRDPFVSGKWRLSSELVATVRSAIGTLTRGDQPPGSGLW